MTKQLPVLSAAACACVLALSLASCGDSASGGSSSGPSAVDTVETLPADVVAADRARAAAASSGLSAEDERAVREYFESYLVSYDIPAIDHVDCSPAGGDALRCTATYTLRETGEQEESQDVELVVVDGEARQV